MLEKFRNLRNDEIEVRIQSNSEKGSILLLYKTARTDSKILDETVGPMNWKCEYKEIKNNMYCGISIYNEKTKEWVTKWNCGTESNTEKEKGEASDALKRAGFTWGIGTELYTSPLIFVKKEDIKSKYDKFSVEKIQIENGEITGLAIKNDTLNKRVFVYAKKKGE